MFWDLGWKRKIKQIELWKIRHNDLDIEQLCRNNRNYVKLWIDPFYGLTRRNPPMWYSRLILEAMIEVYRSWSQQMGFRTDKDIEAIKNKAYKYETVKLSTGEDTVYNVRVGDVWLGESI